MQKNEFGFELTKEREDYLKTIYHLQQDVTPVRTTVIAKALGVEPASVTGAVKRLAELDLLVYQRYRGVSLTEKGEKIALEVIRHHRLIELYLIEALGYSWDEVHDEAERLEHVVSPLFMERIASALGNPQIDPHGEPIPSREGVINAPADTQLYDLPVGAKGIISRVDDSNPDLLRYLGELGLVPGCEIEIIDIAPFEGPISLQSSGSRHVLGLKAASQIYIAINDT